MRNTFLKAILFFRIPLRLFPKILFPFGLIIIFCSVGLFSAKNSQGQNANTLFQDHYKILADTSIDNDTIRFQITPEERKVTKHFYDTIKNRAYRNKLLQTIHDFLIVQSEEAKVLDDDNVDNVDNPFKPYKGKKIKNVKIRQLNVFGTSVEDTTVMDVSWYKEFANWMHITTQEIILKQNLLFEEGDTIDPLLLSDNERILRRLQYIKDARILVKKNKIDSQTVDLVVVTQDVWAKGFNVELASINAGSVQLFDNNIFGIGHRLQTDIVFDYLEEENVGFASYYKISNLLGSFINGRFYYEDVFDEKHFGYRYSRDFFSYKTHWVGGFKGFKHKTRENIRKPDTILYQVPLDYVDHDFWLGYSFPLDINGKLFKRRNRLVLSARYYWRRFDEGPKVTERYNYSYHNNYAFLGNISFSRQNFYKSSLIYGFGRTEDIPVGDLFGYTFGWEVDEFFKRFYSGITLKHGQYFANFGYLANSIDVGGFLYQGDFEQGVFNFNMKYISKLFYLNDLKLRQFVDINYKHGINRFPDEDIAFNSAMDIRGYSNGDLVGDKKLVMKFETVGFTNLFYYGFRVAMYGFMDFGFIGPENKLIFKNALQSGIGLGLRIRNENLVFNTLQVKIGYYPRLSPGDNLLFRISGEKTLAPSRYTPNAPDIVKF